jgi:hypothetical protein
MSFVRVSEYWASILANTLSMQLHITLGYKDVCDEMNWVKLKSGFTKPSNFLPWIQWNCPIPAKSRSFSVPASLWKSVFFHQNLYFFFYIHIEGAPMILKFDPYRVQHFIQNSLIASFLRSLCSTFVVGKEILSFW